MQSSPKKEEYIGLTIYNSLKAGARGYVAGAGLMIPMITMTGDSTYALLPFFGGLYGASVYFYQHMNHRIEELRKKKNQ